MMALSVPYSPISPRQRSGAGGGATGRAVDATASFDIDGTVEDCDKADAPKAKTIEASATTALVGNILVRSNVISIFG